MEPELGSLLSDMLITMTDRGPDSAGIAVYGSSDPDRSKLVVQSFTPDTDFAELKKALGGDCVLNVKDSHAVIELPESELEQTRGLIETDFSSIRIISAGSVIEIYKEVGLPKDVVKRFDIASMRGTHGIGHTRMATESAVTTLGAHPFSTALDQCLVHNGSLSNHNKLRRELVREGMAFETENDSEVAAAYLTSRMAHGMNLAEALESGLQALDGFYTFVVGTRSGFGVLRDPIACKPAVLAETDSYVAFGSEYRALAVLPGIDGAKVWEPEPATVYFWER